MKKINSIRIIDSLAEMTRHYDDSIIAKSLLKAINDTIPSKELKLFKIIYKDDDEAIFSLQLICYLIDNHIDSLNIDFQQNRLPSPLKIAVTEAVESGETQQVINLDDDEFYVIYPSLDDNGRVFSLLIQARNKDDINFDTPRYIYGLLKVYSNYLDLIQKSHTDKLTGLLNREALDKKMTHELVKNNAKQTFIATGGETQRKEDSISTWVGILDIDFFKRVNDQYGHLFGDELLILVSRLLQKLLRHNDHVFRFGGEEFIVLLQAHSLSEAEGAFGRIRKQIEFYKFPKINTITMSTGVTELTNQDSVTEIISEADDALYYAKEHGRNQVVMYQLLIKNQLIEKNKLHIADDIELF